MTDPLQNRLYYGDCLEIMQDMPPDSVDLIYLDPPFNSNRAYNAIYRDYTNRELPDQIEAFCDTWEFTDERRRFLDKLPEVVREAGIDHETARFWYLWMSALRSTQPRLLAYLLYMVERLLPMRGLLKPTGSLYLHCDPTASHYLKVMLDGIFGHKNFLNEIVWFYRKWTNAANYFQRNHDTILVYSKIKGSHVFNKLFDANAPQSVKYERGWDVNVVGGGVRQLIIYDREKAARKINKGNYDRIVDRTGQMMVALPDCWQIPIINSQAKERLGYPTQKPLALLKRIIEASSNPGDIVFDPFCGCATTIAAAHELGRKWIGIDIAFHAIRRVVQERLQESYGLIEDEDYRVDGVPRTLEAAKDLWERDPYHFQRWAIEMVDGFCTTRRTGDGSIDGRLYFRHRPEKSDLQSMILEVKGGKNVAISNVRDLRGAMEREGGFMAGLIIMDALGEQKARNFRQEMADAGDIEVDDVAYPRMQMLSVQEILDGRKFKTPPPLGRGRGGSGLFSRRTKPIEPVPDKREGQEALPLPPV